MHRSWPLLGVRHPARALMVADQRASVACTLAMNQVPYAYACLEATCQRCLSLFVKQGGVKHDACSHAVSAKKKGAERLCAAQSAVQSTKDAGQSTVSAYAP
jgi:hypothetical protein